MRLNCEQARDMLADYLDNSLLPEDRQRLQLHLDHCASCRTDLELQRQWLQDKRPLILKDPGFISAADLSQRIRASLGQLSDEAADTPSDTPAASNRSVRNFWPRRLIVTAAAMLVLFSSVYVFNEIYQKTRDEQTTSPFMVAGGDAQFEQGDDSLAMSEEAAGEPGQVMDYGDQQPVIGTQSLLQDTGWSMYQGSLADLQVGGGLFVRPPSDPEQKETTTSESDDPDSRVEGETAPIWAADLLTGAQAVRVLVRPEPPETLIYSFWQGDSGDEFWQQIQTERYDWPYPAEIVRMPARDEADRIRELLGPDLAADVLQTIELDDSEIIQILIGASDFE